MTIIAPVSSSTSPYFARGSIQASGRIDFLLHQSSTNSLSSLTSLITIKFSLYFDPSLIQAESQRIAQALLHGVIEKNKTRPLSFIPYKIQEEPPLTPQVRAAYAKILSSIQKELLPQNPQPFSSLPHPTLAQAFINTLNHLLSNDAEFQSLAREMILPIKRQSPIIKAAFLTLKAFSCNTLINQITEQMTLEGEAEPSYIKRFIWVPKEFAATFDRLIHNIFTRTLRILDTPKGHLLFHHRIYSLRGHSLLTTLLAMEENHFQPKKVERFCTQLHQFLTLFIETFENSPDTEALSLWKEFALFMAQILDNHGEGYISALQEENHKLRRQKWVELLFPSLQTLASHLGLELLRKPT